MKKIPRYVAPVNPAEHRNTVRRLVRMGYTQFRIGYPGGMFLFVKTLDLRNNLATGSTRKGEERIVHISRLVIIQHP